MKFHAGAVNSRLLFILIQIVLYVSFLTIDITGGNSAFSVKIKFSVIILCFCYALFSKGADKGILFCMKTALLFTLISDLFILILDYYFYGVLTFIVVQQLYGVRLSMAKYCNRNGVNPTGQVIADQYSKQSSNKYNNKYNNQLSNLYSIQNSDTQGSQENNNIERGSRADTSFKKGFIQQGNRLKIRSKKEYGVIVRDFMIRNGIQAAVVLVICFVLNRLGVEPDGLLIASAFYFICIVTNTIRGVKAAINHPHDKGLVLYAFGISLFLLCDINVGFFNISSFITMPESVYNVLYPLSTILMWTFYAPSQALIALSVKESCVRRFSFWYVS